MTELHYCDQCEKEEAHVHLETKGGETQYLCTNPDCMMAAGLCPNCHVNLEITLGDEGTEIYSCPDCDFNQTYKDVGQP